MKQRKGPNLFMWSISIFKTTMKKQHWGLSWFAIWSQWWVGEMFKKPSLFWFLISDLSLHWFQISECEDLDNDIDDIILAFSKHCKRPILHTISFYWNLKRQRSWLQTAPLHSHFLPDTKNAAFLVTLSIINFRVSVPVILTNKKATNKIRFVTSKDTENKKLSNWKVWYTQRPCA